VRHPGTLRPVVVDVGEKLAAQVVKVPSPAATKVP
jgi:hypothetical protein